MAIGDANEVVKLRKELAGLRDMFAAAALTGLLGSGDINVDPSDNDRAAHVAELAYQWADAMLRERAATNHDAAPAAKAAELARSPGQSPRGTGDTTWEPVDVPATWQDECCVVESAFARSGVRPTWPDDEPANIGPMAHAMADEIARLRDVVRQLTSSLLSRPLQSERDATNHDAAPAARAEVATGTGHTQSDTTWEPLCWCCSGPGIQSFHDSKADAEEYREHSGIADEVEVFQVGRAFTLTDAEREFLKLHRERLVWWAHSSKESAAELETVNGLLARLGGDK